MEKKIKNKLLKAIILFIVMFASIGFKVSVKGFSHLNITSFTEEECYNYIMNKFQFYHNVSVFPKKKQWFLSVFPKKLNLMILKVL